MPPVFNLSYRKVGGLRFVRIGKLGFSWYITNKPAKVARTHRASPRIIGDVKYYREYEGGSTVVVYRDR